MDNFPSSYIKKNLKKLIIQFHRYYAFKEEKKERKKKYMNASDQQLVFIQLDSFTDFQGNDHVHI